MNKDITLIVLAAGMGSRFGGLKQVEPMGPNGEFIIDYSVFDAIKAGFTKIVFLIKRENFELFKETIGKRVEPHIKVEYCFQENNNIPDGYSIPDSRKKPLGTAHAILCCRDKVNEPFAIINADDFYGRDAYFKASEFLKGEKDSTPVQYGMIAYIVKNTITDVGAVKRGICEVENDHLLKLTESNVERVNGKIIASPLNGDDSFEVSEDTVVSMNMLLFTPSIFDYIEDIFSKYLENHKSDIDTCEFLIPDVIKDGILEKKIEMEVLPTNAKWQGVTYKEDKPQVVKEIQELIENNVYPQKLWRS